jgi:recombinase
LAPNNKAAAMNRAEQLKPLLGELVAAGMSARQIAAEMTARGVPTPSGGRWHPQSVTRVMDRVFNGRPRKPGESAPLIDRSGEAERATGHETRASYRCEGGDYAPTIAEETEGSN